MKHKQENILKTLKILLEVDDIEIIKCTIESIIEQIEDNNFVEAIKNSNCYKIED